MESRSSSKNVDHEQVLLEATLAAEVACEAVGEIQKIVQEVKVEAVFPKMEAEVVVMQLAAPGVELLPEDGVVSLKRHELYCQKRSSIASVASVAFS